MAERPLYVQVAEKLYAGPEDKAWWHGPGEPFDVLDGVFVAQTLQRLVNHRQCGGVLVQRALGADGSDTWSIAVTIDGGRDFTDETYGDGATLGEAVGKAVLALFEYLDEQHAAS